MKMKKWELAVVAVVLLACAAAGFLLYRPGSPEGAVALISVDSEERYLVDLETRQEPFAFRIETETGKPVSFEVRDHAVRFVEGTCPDHVCEKAGWCRLDGDRAVCMPNRTALVVYPRAELPPDTPARWVGPEDQLREN